MPTLIYEACEHDDFFTDFEYTYDEVVDAFTNNDNYKFTGSNYTLEVCSTSIDVKWINGSTVSFQPVDFIDIHQEYKMSAECHFCEIEGVDVRFDWNWSKK